MSKKILLLSLLVGLAGGFVVYLINGLVTRWMMNWAGGVLLGIYPFAFWYWARPILSKSSKYLQNSSSQIVKKRRLPLQYYFITFLIAVKFIIIGLIIIKISYLAFIMPVPLLAGFLIIAPLVLGMVLARIFWIWFKHKDIEKVNI